MKLIYIAYGNVSVFDSQVIALLNYYSDYFDFNKIILVLGVNYNKPKKNRSLENLNKNIEVKYYKQYPQYLLIENLTIKSLKYTLKEIESIDDYMIHVRNDVLGHYVYLALRRIKQKTNKIIVDVRGAGLEQLIEFSGKNKFILKLKKTQRKQVDKSLNRIKYISVVSESLKDHLKTKIDNEINIKINSCLSNESFQFIEEERNKLRAELNLKPSDKVIVLSTGGNNAWQNTESTIQKLSNKNCKILNLSKTKIQGKNIINRFVAYDEMFKYLCAADFAIIWRKKSITNAVASPVKFSEYVCCGLPVITNDSIDLITDYLVKNDSGEIIDSLDLIDELLLDRVLKIDRNQISKTGRMTFGIEEISNQYLEFYNYVNNSEC